MNTPKEQSIERRKHQRIIYPYADVSIHFPHASGVKLKTQKILDRSTGTVVSQELLIDAPEKEILDRLEVPGVSFDVFLSQLVGAMQSREHSHVNLELKDLRREDFKVRLRVVLSNFRRKSDRKNVVIEITERGVITDAFDAGVRKNIEFLKQSGFSLYLDDYDLTGRLANNVSRIMLARYRGILSGVKIPHEHADLLLTEGKGIRFRALNSIPANIPIIAEGNGLFARKDSLPSRIFAVQDPSHIIDL